MQQLQFIDLQISSTCFGQFLAHLQEHKTVHRSMWYNSPRLLSVVPLQSRPPTDNYLGTLYHMLLFTVLRS